MIKKIILLFVVWSIFIGCSQSTPILHDMDGNKISLEQLKNKWVIINYWASWCDNCIKEIPELNNFYKNNKDKNIVIYGANYNALPIQDLKEDVQKVGIQYPILLEDPSQVWHFELMDAIPLTYIINPEGKLVKTIVGSTSERDLVGTMQVLSQRNSG